MQFDQAGEIIRNVTWYWAADDALSLPQNHYYVSSRSWTPHQQPTLGLGERWDSVTPYYNGAMPGYFPGTGSYCDPNGYFLTGCPSDAPPVEYSDAGIPVCCPQPPCQPFWDESVGHRNLTSTDPVIAWAITADDPNSTEWYDPSTGSAAIIYGNTPGACDPGEYDTQLSLTVTGYPGGLMTIQSYDLATYTGTWTFVPASLGPPGFKAFFTCPPT